MKRYSLWVPLCAVVVAMTSVIGSLSEADAQAGTRRAFLTGAGQGGGPHVVSFLSQPGTAVASFFAFSQQFRGGTTVGSGDVNNDGVQDAIVGAGPGGGPHVIAFDGRALAQNERVPLFSFFAFEQYFTGGVYVAGGDINGDGYDDMIVGAGQGGGPRVQVFSGQNGNVIRNFFAYAEAFRGGVRVGSADVNGDGKDDIICGAGPGGGPHVIVYSGADNSVLHSFFAFPQSFTGGVFVAGGDVSGDGLNDIVVGAGAGSSPRVRIYNGSNLGILRDFIVFPATYTGGVQVGASRVGTGGEGQLVVGSTGLQSETKVYDLSVNINTLSNVQAYPGFNGGVAVSGFSIPVANTPTPAASSTPTATPTPTGGVPGTQTATPTFTPGGPLPGTATSTPTFTPTSNSPSPSVITLSFEGIYDNGDGTFTAYIGYNNTSNGDITIPAGTNGSAKNFFSPSPPNRGQTSVFLKGQHSGAIAIVFDGSALTYTVGADGTLPMSVTFSKDSLPKLSAVEPLSQCIITGTDGTYAAIMGYSNPNKVDIQLKIGTANKFEPGAQSRGQPEKFLQGLNNGAFTILGLNTDLTWKLASKSVLVKSSATQCTCPAVGGAEIRQQLNADALALNALAGKTIELLKGVGTKAGNESADHVNKRRVSNQESIKASTLKIPNVFVTCPSSELPPQCVQVDNQASINQLKNDFDEALNIVKRGVARANFLKTGNTRPANGKTDPLVRDAKVIHDRGLAELQKYPRYNTSCSK